MAKIKVMDQILANKIAAGEVVERCASVVKELVENSIDAESTEIKVELIDSGTKEIKVTDNGIGMEKEDAILAFSRHATSKLQEEEDLYHIHTLGFRGEALASIASVSEITLKTSTGEVGTIVELAGGQLLESKRGDARKGTIISVRNLFYNTPARLKHMKSLYTELSSITDYMNKLALSHPHIQFILSNNGNQLLRTDGSNHLLKTIGFIYGIDLVKQMLEVHGEDADYSIRGYISNPAIHRSSRNHMITIVNGRVVRNMELNRIIQEGYHGYKPDNRYPIVVLEIEVDPSLIDVNIHPTKMDIKFSKLEELLNLIQKMMKDTLKKETFIQEVKVESPSKVTYEQEKMTFDFVKEKEEDVKSLENIPIQNNLSFGAVGVAEKIKPSYAEINQALDIVLEEPAKEAVKERFPMMYPVGLVHGTYIICQNEDGMYLIDQHAAKERINYEYYRTILANPPKEQIDLLIPLTLEFSNQEFLLLKEQIELIRSFQIEIEEFGFQSFCIKSHPTWIKQGEEEMTIRTFIELILSYKEHFEVGRFREKLAKMLSCKHAIKANQNITMEEMEQLLKDLSQCENPFHCPHGRPVCIFYSNYDLEKLFKRSGFDTYK